MIFLAWISFLAWIYLLFWRGGYWLIREGLPAVEAPANDWPSVTAIVPARDEAEVLPLSLPSLLAQDYPGPFRIILVDDGSKDGTGTVARKIAAETDAAELTVVAAPPLPPGWAGKVWAMEQGVQACGANGSDFLLFTDADIQHPLGGLRSLVAKAVSDECDLVSLMVMLRVRTFWEKLLIPAFVYFFRQLYPFRWVNDVAKRTAAAAGGVMLVRRTALEKAGGLEDIRYATIDDCALARLLKLGLRVPEGRIWLGMTKEHRSLRGYDSLAGIWNMVARTAFVQLKHSFLLLLATTVILWLLYAIPAAMIASFLVSSGPPGSAFIPCVLALLIMTITYSPMVQWYAVVPLFALCLPVIALLYLCMTWHSAFRSWKGRGGGWKDRVYPMENTDSQQD